MTESNTGITHEKAVVACLIANTGAITYQIGLLKTDMFSSRKPGFIYKAIAKLLEQVERSNYNLIDRATQEITQKGYQVRMVNYKWAITIQQTHPTLSITVQKYTSKSEKREVNASS